MSGHRFAVIFYASVVLTAVHAFADLGGSYVVPLDDPAIQYATRPLADPVTSLQERIKRGEAKLEYTLEHGYLASVLRNLQVPVSSQVLVFSKTSFQGPRISPRVPRALYFNDRVSVGWVKGGDVVEIAAVDPSQGVIFYTLDQERSASPQIVRRDECLQCHATGNTLGVPGFVVRSVYPDATGAPLFQLGTFVTDHRSPLSERWGGWYVSGTHGSQTHLGNVTYESDGKPGPDSPRGGNVTDLTQRFNAAAYLSPHSDIAALMVLEHQSRMQNLITRVGYETRMALVSQTAMNEALKQPVDEVSDSTKRRIDSAADELTSYMLFGEETRLESPIAGTSNFADEFARQGPRDHRGRSLRQFDLTRRMFKYPCSYLIYSDAFDALPDQARERIYYRLWEVLTGRDTSPTFAHLSTADRQAIREILVETKSGLPEYWLATSQHQQN